MRTFLMQFLGIVLLISITGFVLVLPFTIPNKLAGSLTLGILVYALFEYCFLEEKRLIRNTGFCIRERNFEYIFLLAYFLSLILAIVLAEGSIFSFYSLSLFSNPLSLAKLLASILLTSFLPGYAFLNIIEEVSKKRLFSTTGVGVLSILLSFLITSVTTYIHWAVNRDLSSLNYTLFSSYTLFLTLYTVSSLIRRKRPDELKRRHLVISSASFYRNLILLSVGTYLIWMFFSTHSAQQTMYVVYDELDHVGLTVQLSKGWQSWQSAQVRSGIYPYFLHLIIYAAASISNMPIINVHLSFFFLLILPAFAFYFMAQMIFGNEGDIPLFAVTIFSVFSGFGWIYATYLQRTATYTSQATLIRDASQTTYDIIYSTWFPIYVAPYAVDLSIFFVLIGLMGSKQIDAKTRCVLTVLLVVLGTFVHVEKVLAFAFLLLILSFLYASNLAKSIDHPKTLLFSYIAGLTFVFLLDFLAPIKIARELFSTVWKVFLLFVIGSVSVLVVEKLTRKASFLRFKINTNRLQHALACIALSLYLLSSIAFFYSFSTYCFNEQTVPLWFLALKTGVAGVISLFGLFFVDPERNKVDLFVTLFISTLFMELLLYRLPTFSISVHQNFLFDISLPEFRVVRDVLWAFLSVIAGYGMKKLVKFVKEIFSPAKSLPRCLGVCLLFFATFAVGIPSHLLKVEYFASFQRVISVEEAERLNFLNTLEVPSGSFILSGFSKDEAHAVTGAGTISFLDPVYGPLILDSKTPGTTLHALHYLNISYFYMSNQDFRFLENQFRDSFFMWLLPHFPLIFRDDAISVYKVPPLSPPLKDSNVKVVTADLLGDLPVLLTNVIWHDDDFSEGWREVSARNVDFWNFRSDGNTATIEAKTITKQQAAVLYVYDVEEYILTTNDTVAAVKLKSNSVSSYATIDLLYSDGSVQRLQLGGTGVIKALEWTTVINFLQPNRIVKGIRVGITDRREGRGETVGCSFDYIGIYKMGRPTDYHIPSLMLALMQINFTTVSETDPSLLDSDTIFVPDVNVGDGRISEFLNWVNNGGILVITSSQGRGSFGNLLGIEESGRYLAAHSIVDNKGLYVRIPEITVPIIQIDDNSTSIIASYAFESSPVSPFALLKNHGKGKMLYLEIDRIFENLTIDHDLTKTVSWIRDLLQNHARFGLFNPSTYSRTFYIKNIGEIFLHGETRIVTPSIVFGLEKLNKATVSFSNDTHVEKSESILENITLSPQYNGSIPLTVYANGNVTISPLRSINYVKLRLNGEALFRFDISPGDQVKLISEDGRHADLLFRDGVLVVGLPCAKEIELIVRSPVITSIGTTAFDSLFASFPYEIRSSGEPGIFNGYIEFNVGSSGGQVLLLDEVKINGNLHLEVTGSSPLSDDLIFFVHFPHESAFFASIIIFLAIVVFHRLDSRK